MTEQYSIPTPPSELVQKWSTASSLPFLEDSWAYEMFIAHHAAQWGADQELEACCDWLVEYEWDRLATQLRAARRPKSLSLAEKALEEVGAFEGMGTCNIDIIRRALERLQELEGQGDG